MDMRMIDEIFYIGEHDIQLSVSKETVRPHFCFPSFLCLSSQGVYWCNKAVFCRRTNRSNSGGKHMIAT
ncbi:hypothetical protein M514_19909 [Trichuris suis]|uniref:Uncharacterized protein n=1 Tax=Trichuris suis TaxID=68888 RepID=A0A085NED0_9BILA|nr:hypothetical protein M514_19909 [Trichuris suis]